MASAGQRTNATELLGRYLATAPDDGEAWLELGRFYILDSRDWHQRGHVGEPSAAFFLDFAATALDASLRLPTDSALYLRAMVEMDRAAMQVEDDGWLGARAQLHDAGRCRASRLCAGGRPQPGELLPAWAGCWSPAPNSRRSPPGAPCSDSRSREDLILFLPARYDEDSLYRLQMAAALEIHSDLPVAQALTEVAARRPVCLSPGTDDAVRPHLPLIAFRLVRIAGPQAPESPEPLGIIELTAVERSRSSGLSGEVVSLYARAATGNPLLCTSLLAPLGAGRRGACGR